MVMTAMPCLLGQQDRAKGWQAKAMMQASLMAAS